MPLKRWLWIYSLTHHGAQRVGAGSVAQWPHVHALVTAVLRARHALELLDSVCPGQSPIQARWRCGGHARDLRRLHPSAPHSPAGGATGLLAPPGFRRFLYNDGCAPLEPVGMNRTVTAISRVKPG